MKRIYYQNEMESLARALIPFLKIPYFISLEGPLGAGKSTFASILLNQLQVQPAPQGSPTFAAIHEYQAAIGKIAHIDFYRIQSELELQEKGLLSYYWENACIVISEWLSLWPNLENQILASDSFLKIQFSFTPHPNQRAIQIESNFNLSL